MRVAIRFIALSALVGLCFQSVAQETPTSAGPVADNAIETVAGKFTPLGLNKQGHKEFRREKDGATMVLIPAGNFPKRIYEGNPLIGVGSFQLHTDAFLIDKYEVTNAQAAAYLNQLEGLKFKGDQVLKGDKLMARTEKWGLKIADGKLGVQKDLGNYPSVGTSGYLALDYAKWIGGDLPWGYEWEKAAAGEAGFDFPWGFTLPNHRHANSFLHGPKSPMPVGSHPDGVSPYGCHDMAGNVYDRCYWYDDDDSFNPELEPDMIRGGAWVTPHWANLRCVDRCRQPMDVAEGSVGFRCLIRNQEVLKALGVKTAKRLRVFDDVDQAFKEAAARNVPILLHLAYETCGQCDRTRAMVFTEDKFIEFFNEHAVLLVGHNPGDGVDDPIELAEGPSLLYPGCKTENLHETFDYFCRTVNTRIVPRAIWDFVITPGQFVLNPHLELQETTDQLILVPERDVPKSGDDVDSFIKLVKKAQLELGEAQTRSDYLAGKEGPNTTWAPPEDEDE